MLCGSCLRCTHRSDIVRSGKISSADCLCPDTFFMHEQVVSQSSLLASIAPRIPETSPGDRLRVSVENTQSVTAVMPTSAHQSRRRLACRLHFDRFHAAPEASTATVAAIVQDVPTWRGSDPRRADARVDARISSQKPQGCDRAARLPRRLRLIAARSISKAEKAGGSPRSTVEPRWSVSGPAFIFLAFAPSMARWMSPHYSTNRSIDGVIWANQRRAPAAADHD